MTPRTARCARHSTELPALSRPRGSQQGVRRAARELPGVRLDTSGRDARARRPGKDADSVAPAGFARSGTSRTKCARRCSHMPGRSSCRPGTKASASCCSRRGTTRIPALVNGRCKVLAGQVRRANGGLYYMFPAEFDEAADFLLNRPAERDAMGRQGLAYVDREYRWPTVLSRVESLLQDVRRRSAPRLQNARS